jgi:transglutaminase-like putative cysteine protease
VARDPQLADIAAPFQTDDGFEAAAQLMNYVNQNFEYRQNVTDVSTTVLEVLAHRGGVCQDLAHVLIGLCRALDLPARYVSGYTVSDGGRGPRRGGGASHAWAEVYTDGYGWRGFDPTNNLLANDRYVKLATGRDYSDVAPTRGTYRGSADERLTVSVVTRVLS